MKEITKTIKTITYNKQEVVDKLGIKGKLVDFYYSIMNGTFEFKVEVLTDEQSKKIEVEVRQKE